MLKICTPWMKKIVPSRQQHCSVHSVQQLQHRHISDSSDEQENETDSETHQDDDPLSFWRSNSSKFPLLQELARDTLSQSACSVPVENMFSTMGLLLNGKRSALAPANWLSFIHDNFALYFKTQNDNDV